MRNILYRDLVMRFSLSLALGVNAGCEDLKTELRLESARKGLALAAPTGAQIEILPFDSAERQLTVNYRAPNSAFGKKGEMIIWWFRRSFYDYKGQYLIESIPPRTVIARGEPQGYFTPLTLSESSRRIAYWGGSDLQQHFLFWSDFELAVTNFIDDKSGIPDWSPDGHRLVYEKEGHIFILDVSSKTSRAIASGHDPTWSSNGQWVSFISLEGKASLIGTDGTPQKWALSTHMPLSSIQWSPDGRFVSFAEALPAVKAVFDRGSHLVVCRSDNGEAVSVKTFGIKAFNKKAFHWISNYRGFDFTQTSGRY